jgi:hypothetical protein
MTAGPSQIADRTRSFKRGRAADREEVNMLNQIRNRLSSLVLLATSATVSALAAPRNSILLPLVPPGAEIVSGIANPETPGASGRLLLVTDNNNRDFEDCLALLGIDGGRSIEQVIEAAASPFSRDRSEYVLLLAGSFNHFSIYKAALENGATSLVHDGVSLLAISPFQRQQRQFNRVRWLAILDERILIFGTPAKVSDALDRHAHNEQTDPVLARRLGQIHADVDSWTVIALQPPLLERHLADYLLSEGCRAELKDADELAVGIHYGPLDRVYFAFHKLEGSESAGPLPTGAQLFPASVTSVKQLRIDKDSTAPDWIRGSFRVRDKELDHWLSSVDKAGAADQQVASKR